jgi:hypothetical protein
MASLEEIRTALEDLIEVLHLQAQELQKLITCIEQRSGALPYRHQLPLVSSELSELHHRVRQYAAETAEG